MKLSGFALATSLLAACATSSAPSAEAIAKSNTLVVLTQKMEPLTIKSAQPDKVLARAAVTDLAVSYEPTDAQANQKPELVGAAYTYNKKDPELTTNYAIGRKSGTLVTQGSAEGVQPVVSANTGLLRTVGSLGMGPLLDAAFDIADVSDIAFTAVRTASQPSTQLYTVNLSTGRAARVGTLADGAAVLGMAVEP